MSGLIYLDTCMPDYFTGFSGKHVYAIPLYTDITYSDVFDALEKAINTEEIDEYEDNYNKLLIELEGFKHMARELGHLNEKFMSYALDDDCGLYAYFGVTE